MSCAGTSHPAAALRAPQPPLLDAMHVLRTCVGAHAMLEEVLVIYSAFKTNIAFALCVRPLHSSVPSFTDISSILGVAPPQPKSVLYPHSPCAMRTPSLRLSSW